MNHRLEKLEEGRKVVDTYRHDMERMKMRFQLLEKEVEYNGYANWVILEGESGMCLRPGRYILNRDLRILIGWLVYISKEQTATEEQIEFIRMLWGDAVYDLNSYVEKFGAGDYYNVEEHVFPPIANCVLNEKKSIKKYGAQTVIYNTEWVLEGLKELLNEFVRRGNYTKDAISKIKSFFYKQEIYIMHELYEKL